MKTKNISLFWAAGLTALFSFSACSSRPGESQPTATVQVQVYQPTARQDAGLYVSGQVTAQQTAHISTRVMGYVDKVFVKQGDRVKPGQRLVALNSHDLLAKKSQAEAGVREAEAATRHARRDYERFQTLHTQQSVSDKELENMELNYTSMEAKLQMARQALQEVQALLAYTDIRAPFAGVVTQRMIDEGSTAHPGMPLLLLDQEGALCVQASVAESYITQLQPGTAVKVTIPSQQLHLEGTLTEISPSAAQSGGQYGIKVALKADASKALHAGMYASLLIPTAETDVANSPTASLWIDPASVVKRDQLTGVYVATPDHRALLRWIRLGKTVNGQVEVLAGLKADERIIRQADGKLYNGVQINVAP